MEMVSAAKLKRFQKVLDQAAPYTTALEGLLGRLLEAKTPFRHPLLTPRPEKKRALMVVTSDTDLCGSFNMDLVDEATRFLGTLPETPVLVGFGKSGVNALGRMGLTCHTVFKDTKTADLEHAVKKTGLLLETLFREHKVDAVYVTYPRFMTKASFKAVTEKLLPLTLEAENAAVSSVEYIFEPGAEFLFTKLVPMIFEAKVRELFMGSFVAEQTARMNAMHQATKNAGELIESLTLTRNKIRQAAITKELIEIVSGSKAAKQ